MRLKIYQIDAFKDKECMSYKPYNRIDKVDPSIYRKAIDAEVNIEDPEGAFRLFNSGDYPL